MPETVHIVDAFTETPGAGNRAGVVLNADHLGSNDMQAIAAFAGYSETAFVLQPESPGHTLRVRYFTQTREVPICGHATVAAHFLRASTGHAGEYPLVARTGAGDLPVALDQAGSRMRVSMTQTTPEFFPPLGDTDREALADALGMNSSEFAELPVQTVSTGHSKVMVPLQRRDVLDELRPDMQKLTEVSEMIGCNGFFTFVLEGTRAKPVTYGRMFAPAIGINEDSVTGNANGPAGAYLVEHGLIDCPGSISYCGHQGIAMGKPGTVYVTVKKEGENLKVKIAGEAVIAGTREYPGA
ncbi:MAG: PhzF family isomerase [Pseudomonadota bacterium]